MARTLLALAVAAMMLTVPATARARDCGPAAAATVERSAAVRVYFTARGSTKHYFACWRRTGGRPVELLFGDVDRPDFLNRFLLRGRYLAYVYTSCQRGGACDSFQVELLDAKLRTTVAATDYLPGSVRTLVGTRGGAAAFLASDGRERYEAHTGVLHRPVRRR